MPSSDEDDMFVYHLRIALKSLRRNPWLTALLIFAVALGICISTSFTTMRHVLAKDPLPRGRSEVLHYVRMDSWDPKRPYLADDPKSLPTMLTYRDARSIMESKIPTRQTPTFLASLFVFPDAGAGRPFPAGIRMVMSDFFPMFAVPFRYGSGWDHAADAKPEQVVVIDDATNEKLFAGKNSIGRSIRIGYAGDPVADADGAADAGLPGEELFVGGVSDCPSRLPLRLGGVGPSRPC